MTTTAQLGVLVDVTYKVRLMKLTFVLELVLCYDRHITMASDCGERSIFVLFTWYWL